MSLTTQTAPAGSFLEPAGIKPRGTIIVLPGRGETLKAYQRFGQRLSFDAYRVIVADAGAEQALQLAQDPEVITPVVLLGVDAGAVTAIRLVREEPQSFAALILAGLALANPDGTSLVAGDLTAELAARTACVNHQQILTQTPRSSLFAASVQLPASVTASAHQVQIPLLAIHGAADSLTPAEVAVAEYRKLGAKQILTITGGLHDILNDLPHRSVAAHIVLFLEQLKAGPYSPAIVTYHAVEGSS